MSYGVFRLFIEFLRNDNRGQLVGKISPSQFWSILLVVAGIGMIFVLNYFYKKEEKT